MDKYNMEMEIDINTIPGKVINNIKCNSTVLEFGPASGRMTCYLKEELNCKVYIVEINAAAYEHAIQYAVDGVCGNIEDYLWIERFKDVKFDYIIFADVLEHLSCPDQVIVQAKDLLKDEGSLIVSIPNIGHADILFKLYLNRFEYTNLGLLDNTHVHFWGYNNIESFFNMCGFSVLVEDAAYVAPFYTEQQVDSKEIPVELRNMICRRKMSNVYEFFLVLKKSEYFYKENLHKTKLIKEHIIDDLYATVFFDLGEGYTQENVMTIYPNQIFEDNYIEYYIEEVPEGCTAIRFDPAENMGVIISDLTIKGNKGRYIGKALNGIELENQLLFSDNDPQIEIELGQNCSWIKIKARIYKYEDENTYELVEGLKAIEELKQEIKKIDKEADRIKEENKDFHKDNLTLIEENKKINEALQRSLDEKLLLSEKIEEFLNRNQELSNIVNEIKDENLSLYKKLEVNVEERNQLYKKIINEQNEISEIKNQNLNLYKKLEESIEEKNQLYKRIMDELDKITETKQKQKELSDDRDELHQQLQAELEQKEILLNRLRQYQNDVINLSNQVNQINQAYMVILDSQCWKMTKPIRKMLEIIKSTKIGHLSHKTLFYIKHYGMRRTIDKVVDYGLKHHKIAKANMLLGGVEEQIPDFKRLIKIFNEDIKDGENNIYLEKVLASYDKRKKGNKSSGKIVLLVSHELALTGAPVALYYFAKSLKDKGDHPVIICRSDGGLTADIVKDEIPVIIYPQTYTSNLIEKIAPLFDFVVANTIVSYPVINMLSDKDIPVVWWIHEAVVSYSDEVLLQLPNTVATNIHVYCGGGYAKKVLLDYRNMYSPKELLYYVPEIKDNTTTQFHLENTAGKIVFAIIGMQELRKGQDVLVDAIASLSEEIRNQALFVFIGKRCNEYIYERVQDICNRYPENTRHIEELTQEQLHAFYEQMDCLVCASKDDPMPIVVTEAMMLSKTIICSENTGSAELLREMNSGLIYYNNSYIELAEKITYVINNIQELDEIRNNARSTYDKYFSKQVFDMNVKDVIDDINREVPTISVPLISNNFSIQRFIDDFKSMYMKDNDLIIGEELLREYDKESNGRKILIISHEFSLTGAPIAIHYLAKVLIENGDCPIILSPYDGRMKDEIIKDNIPVMVYGELYSTDFIEKYDKCFDLIVLNTVVTYRSLFSLKNSETPIMWWIHDSNASYDIGGFKNCLPAELPNNSMIYCGGNYAREALIKNYPNYEAEVFLYYVPDLIEKISSAPIVDIGAQKGKFTFTIIGMQDDRKGHDVFAAAIDLLDQEIIEKCNFVFIGKKMSKIIWDKIQTILHKYPENTTYIEEVNRDELISVYHNSDCIVCSSKDDPMPIFVTEAMLMSKVVICSENTGSASLIEEMNSGFIYRQDSPYLLAEKMKYVYEQFDTLDDMRRNARITYEKYFSYQAFDKGVKDILSDLCVNREEDYFNGVVSIVIPTYNPGESLIELIGLLKKQEKIREIEITIVDSGSKDSTIEICKNEGINLIQISQEQFSHSFARNLGADHSKGDILIFMTQDAMPTSTLWASNLIKPIVKEGIAAVSCMETCNEDIELYYKVSSWTHGKYIGVNEGDVVCSFKNFKTQEELRKSASLNDVTCAVNHSVFNAFKYRHNYAEDLDLGIRLIKSGYKLKLMSSERVIHGHNRSAGYYVKRTLVEDKALAVIMNSKCETKEDSVICTRIVIGYKAITIMINNLRTEIKEKITIPAFYDRLNNQFNYILSQDVFNMSINKVAYSDTILDEMMNKLTVLGDGKIHNEANDIIHMCKYYCDMILKDYIVAHYQELEIDVVESIYDAIFKQMAVFIGLDLSKIEEQSQLKPYIQSLTKGV